MLKYITVFVRRKKTWQDSCKSFVNWSKNVNLFYTITLSKTHLFLFKTRETISVQTDHCCFSEEGKQDRKPSRAKCCPLERQLWQKQKLFRLVKFWKQIWRVGQKFFFLKMCNIHKLKCCLNFSSNHNIPFIPSAIFRSITATGNS